MEERPTPEMIIIEREPEKPKKGKFPIGFGVLGAFVLVLIIFSSFTVFVHEDEAVCIKRFGEVLKVYDTPGLHFKTPFLDSTQEIPKLAMVYDLSPSEVLTLDKKNMIVDSYAVWRISDPLMFLKTAVTIEEAKKRLDINVYNATKNLLSSMEQAESVSARGRELDTKITEQVRATMEYYGITVVDVQIKQFDLPPDNKNAVYRRMISERGQIAAQYTAEGRSEAEIIRNTADKEKTLVLSLAKAQAEQIKAEGESEYMRILADAYRGADRVSFYEFLRSLDALKIAIKGDKTIVLPLDSPLTQWLVTK